MNPLSLLIVCLLGWMNRHQQLVIEYLQEQLGRRPRFTDDRRRRLAAKGKRVGRKGLMQFASIVTPNTLLAWHRRLIASTSGRVRASFQRCRPGVIPLA